MTFNPDWRKLYWTEHETDSEHAERVATAEKGAGWYFDFAGQNTQAAHDLFGETAEMLMRDGEVSEEMSNRWDAMKQARGVAA